MRHFRTEAGLTLDQLGADVGVAASQLSLMENGKREPRLSLLGHDRRAARRSRCPSCSSRPRRASAPHLEIELDRAQSSPVYAELGLPAIRAGKGMGDDTLRALVGLHQELARRSREADRHARGGAPRQHRAARHDARARQPPARDRGARRGPAAQGRPRRRRAHPPLGAPDGRAARIRARARATTCRTRRGRSPTSRTGASTCRRRRSRAATACGRWRCRRSRTACSTTPRPTSYAEFLHQRLEINYFASACLMPLTQSVDFLRQAKADRNIAIEDFRDAFGTTHESAALRFTNLATPYLDMTWHFLRVGDDGAVYKAYENDGLRLPVDVTGSTEGEIVCRRWSARRAFARTNRTTEFYQYTDTPQGSFFESTQIGTSSVRRVLDHARACRSPTRSGSAGARPRGASSHAAPTRAAASARPPSSPSTGRAAPGPAPRCTRTSSRRCRPARSRASTTASCTSSSETHALELGRRAPPRRPASRSQRAGSAMRRLGRPGQVAERDRHGRPRRPASPARRRAARRSRPRARDPWSASASALPTTLPVALVASKRPSP